jgi:hypothetical protein
VSIRALGLIADYTNDESAVSDQCDVLRSFYTFGNNFAIMSLALRALVSIPCAYYTQTKRRNQTKRKLCDEEKNRPDAR